MPPAAGPIQRFLGKTAMVTGGGSGIGRATVLRLAQEGAEVVVCDLSQEAADETVALVRAQNGTARAVVCDVSAPASVAAAFETVGRVDVLVNSAGIAHVGTVLTTTPEDLDRIYAVNVRGTYLCLQAAVKQMRAQGAGVIVNLASVASKIGIADRFAYSMSKGAVLTMTLSVARDFLADRIRCNCICPARIHTPFVDGFLAKNYPDRQEEMFATLSAAQPIGRMGKPEEVAALAAFLCSDEAAFITGAAYDLDGGFTLLR